MAYQPRLLADGTPCCSILNADGNLAYKRNPCAKCQEHHRAAERARLRTTAFRATEDYTPVDPYAADIARLRRELPSTRWPEPPVTPPPAPGDFSPPDPYREQLERLRKENR